MLALLGESRYQIIAPLNFIAYENFISIEYRNPPRVNCDPVCDGFEELTFKIFMAIDDCIDPPRRCNSFIYPKRVCGVGEVWSRRPGAPHIKSATSIQLVGQLLELCCYGPDSAGCGLVVSMSLAEGVSTLVSLFGRAEFTEGSINDFVLFKELNNRTVVNIPAVVCEGDCVDVQSDKIMPVYTCPDCIPREYFDKGECVNNPPPVEVFPNFPNLPPGVTEPEIVPGQTVRLQVRDVSSHTLQWNYTCAGTKFIINDYPGGGTGWSLADVPPLTILPSGALSPSVSFQPTYVQSSGSSPDSCDGVIKTSTSAQTTWYATLSNGQIATRWAGRHLLQTGGPLRSTKQKLTYTSEFRLVDQDGNVLWVWQTPSGPSTGDQPEAAPSCPTGQCRYMINIMAALNIGITVNLLVKVKLPSGQYTNITTPVRLGQSFTTQIGSLGPFCGSDVNNIVTGLVANVAASAVNVVVNRAVDAAISALIPVGGTLLSQLVDVDFSTSITTLSCS